MLWDRLRYEGHPSLWYLILYIPSKLLPYWSLRAIAVLIATASVAVVVFRSPFPRMVTSLIPFTFFVFYQYGVVARSYVLLPLLLFLLADAHGARLTNLGRYTLLNVLLVHTSVYSAVISASVMGLLLIEIMQRRRELSRRQIRRIALLAALYLASLLVLVPQLMPPDAAIFAEGWRFDVGRLLPSSAGIMNSWISESAGVSVFVLGVSCLWFWRRKTLALFLLPTSATLVLFWCKYYNVWHQGILFLWWLTVLWISLARDDQEPNPRFSWARSGVLVALSITLLVHVYWGVRTSLMDLKGPFSAGSDVAVFLKAHRRSDSTAVATTYWSTAIQPYFASNVFENRPGGTSAAYWIWAVRSGNTDGLDSLLSGESDIVVVGRPSATPRRVGNYRLAGVFDGHRFWKTRVWKTDRYAVYVRD